MKFNINERNGEPTSLLLLREFGSMGEAVEEWPGWIQELPEELYNLSYLDMVFWNEDYSHWL